VRDLILFGFIVVLGTAGELCIARAMKQVGEVKRFHPMAILRVMRQAMGVPWIWAGVSMMACAFFALLTILSVDKVSFVVPVTAANYVVGALGGVVFLHEHVSKQRWAGVSLICLGVALVLIGH
jgi:multidrug transporter EmrE-like cation transporter